MCEQSNRSPASIDDLNDIIINDCSSVAATKHNSTDINSPFSSKRSRYNNDQALRNTISFTNFMLMIIYEEQALIIDVFIIFSIIVFVKRHT